MQLGEQLESLASQQGLSLHSKQVQGQGWGPGGQGRDQGSVAGAGISWVGWGERGHAEAGWLLPLSVRWSGLRM